MRSAFIDGCLDGAIILSVANFAGARSSAILEGSGACGGMCTGPSFFDLTSYFAGDTIWVAEVACDPTGVR